MDHLGTKLMVAVLYLFSCPRFIGSYKSRLSCHAGTSTRALSEILVNGWEL
jgi:hypothetical protein